MKTLLSNEKFLRKAYDLAIHHMQSERTLDNSSAARAWAQAIETTLNIYGLEIVRKNIKPKKEVTKCLCAQP
jgi:hypothetical protein